MEATVNTPKRESAGAWTYHVLSGEVWLSEPLQRLFAVPARLTAESFIALIHPDDRGLLRKQLNDLTLNKPLHSVLRLAAATHTDLVMLSAEMTGEAMLAAGIAMDAGHGPGPGANVGNAELSAGHTAVVELLLINDSTVEVQWSDNLFRLLGFNRSDFVPAREHLFALLHPLDVGLLQRHDNTPRQIRLKTKDSGFRWFLVSSRKVVEVETLISRIIYVFTDVHELKQKEQQLSGESTAMGNLLEQLPGYLLMMDEQLNIVFYNAGVRRRFSPARRTVPFTRWSKLVEDPDRVQRILKIAFHKPQLIRDALITTLPGLKPLSLAWNLACVSRDDRPALLCSGSDITGLHIGQLMLSEENKRLKEFARMASHNLRGPVANSLSLIDLYLRSNNPEEQQLYITKLDQVTKKLHSTISGLSEFLRKKDRMEKEPVEFQRVLDDTLHLFSTMISETHARIIADFSLCPSVDGYRVIIESIFQNLISNSIKYRNILSHPEIHITSRLQDSRCILTFTDNGMGIDMTRYGDKVFGLYNTFHENADSLGVGLYLVKKQLEDRGGSIVLESSPGKGSTFIITL